MLSDKFATIGTLDDGWDGKAMYFTSSARYAARYCPEGGGCSIMCYISLLNPFPAVSADATLKVSPIGSESAMDYRPLPTGTDDAIYDELAIFQEPSILP